MTPKEDRRYFRIHDFLPLSFRKLDEEEYQLMKMASQYADVPSLDELSDIDQRIQMLVDKLMVKNSDMAELGLLLNKKIQIVIENSEFGNNLSQWENMSQLPVDMSACGIAFPSDETLDKEQKLELEMVLHSGKQRLKLLGRVIACEEGAEGLCKDAGMTYTIRTEFLDISEQIQEFLIQYLVKRQGVLIKASRNDKPTPIDKMEW
ncbi:MAG: hypothetical protein GKR91_18780 [Pseudomonadales bacterium]|nr:hypothetical protein [Pseudomonadales bacterium]